MPYDDIKYVAQCPKCLKTFTLPDSDSRLPKHPPRGVEAKPLVPYEPCRGSGLIVPHTGIKIHEPD